MTFPSVVLFGEELALAAIKVVDDGYPLRGRLTTASQAFGEPQQQFSGPPAGEAWVESRLLALLGAEVGDQVEMGNAQLTISAVIVEESDRGGNFYTLSPRLMMNRADLASAKVLGPGARVRYRLLLGGEEAALQQFRQQIELDSNQRFESLDDSNQAMSRALSRAKQYLGLAALLAVVLASVAVAISAQRYAQRHFDISALMRTFGLARAQVFQLYASQLLILAVLATAVGIGLALALQHALLEILAEVLPEQLPEAHWSAWLLGASSGTVTLLGFGLPYLLPLSRVSPLRVLRRDLVPVPLSGWLVIALALAALTALLWLFTQDAVLSVGVMLGGSLVVLVLLLLLQGLISLAQRGLQGRELPLVVRFAWQHLSRHRRQTAGQILAFSLTLMVMVVIAAVRNDLLADWQASLPDDAPNVFAINIQQHEADGFVAALEQAGYQHQRLYPMVPGRLLSINGTDVQTLEVADDPAINRDLALTADSYLPDSNRIVEGSWEALQNGNGQVSIEERLAGRLGVELGDTLSFRAGGVDFDATISSIREVDWGSLSPNFYMMFSDDVLASLPRSYLTSFYVAPGQSDALTGLIRQFPSVTLLDMQFVLGQIQTLLQQVTLAVELILLFVLVAAVLVLVAALIASLSERLREGAMLRTLGGSSGLIRRSQLVEFSLLALLASGLALLGGEAVVLGIYQIVLNIPYQSLGWVWLWLPPVTVLVLVALGLWLMRRAVTVSPLGVLRSLE
ncbi:ABC transporter permease [Bacterioplanes sanyensis]|uniref:ABC transporter permease n=1 Tax=Bacterioplanes sanyensis TaxID=1249553 RepID=A0A222FHS1_9GAMM|nr:FtsX-like permease family protein [Bacterioplanes sanyensis]ASP38310.1 ABC transporter permease [Bacterioplanes sanyensis]